MRGAKPELSAWSERRPERTESERADIAERYAAHLPKPIGIVRVSDDDLDAMRAAFIRRFDEDLPRTETLMAVAHIGYRMALRDSADFGHLSPLHHGAGPVEPATRLAGCSTPRRDAGAQEDEHKGGGEETHAATLVPDHVL